MHVVLQLLPNGYNIWYNYLQCKDVVCNSFQMLFEWQKYSVFQHIKDAPIQEHRFQEPVEWDRFDYK